MASVLKVDSIQDTSGTGNILMPNRPCFYAYMSSGTFAPDSSNSTKTPLNATEVNQGSCWSTTDHQFTAPVAGKYFFGIQLYLGFSVTAIRVMHSVFRKNGSSSQQCELCGGTNADGGTHYHPTATGHCMINLAANDYVTFNLGSASFSGSGNTYLYAQSRFFGYLIG